jgi:hypothetical protein
MHDALGIDGRDSPRQRFHLRLAQLAVQRVKLAIDVADAHVVQIDQAQPANAGTGQRFDSPGADTAQPNYTNVSVPDSV